VKAFIAIILFFVLQSQHLLMVGTIVHYQWNKKEITAKYCVNKNKPAMHCNGKCHLKKQLKQIDEVAQQNSVPNPQKEMKFFATEPFVLLHANLYLSKSYLQPLLKMQFGVQTNYYNYLYSYQKQQPPACIA
jgi:hypothetical protein